MTPWKVEFEKSAIRDLDRLDADIARRIIVFLHDRVAVLDHPTSLAQPLAGPLKGIWRWRVGDYRILGRIEGERLVIKVVEIGHRREVYR